MRRRMYPHRSHVSRNKDQPTPPPPADPLKENVSYAKYWDFFKGLAQAMDAQGNQLETVLIYNNSNLAAARV